MTVENTTQQPAPVAVDPTRLMAPDDPWADDEDDVMDESIRDAKQSLDKQLHEARIQAEHESTTRRKDERKK